jgi:RHS repeat-associated protein
VRFTGKERDAESGLDYFGARYYGSALGRFMSPDWSATPQAVPYADFADPQTLNLYSYVRNNPFSKADPDGHCGLDDPDGCTFKQWVGSLPDRLVGGLKFEANAVLEMVGVRLKFQASNAEQADAMAAGEQLKPEFQTALAIAIPGPKGMKGEAVEPEVAPNVDAARDHCFRESWHDRRR